MTNFLRNLKNCNYEIKLFDLSSESANSYRIIINLCEDIHTGKGLQAIE
jgi:hypothetical protein